MCVSMFLAHCQFHRGDSQCRLLNIFQAVHFLLSAALEKKCVRTRQLRRRVFCCSTQSSCALVLLRVGAGAFTVHMFARTMMELSKEGRKHEQHITAQTLDGLPLKS